jgi:23S rRNA (adenine2503-C2)-methyltransferase
MIKTNLKALSRAELPVYVKEFGLTPFRGKQLIHWIYERRTENIAEISEYSKELRDRLAEQAYISNLKVLDRLISVDGTEKYLWELEDGETIESVLISEEDRLTLCISSQVGCALKCAFCLTGTFGLKRNLEAHEIVDQVIAVARLVAPREITNIVLMGMGEPLMNFDNVIEALWRMTDWIRFTARRITLSTAGIVPKMMELPSKAPAVNLAISLNATTENVRDRVMPVNKTYPLKELLDACRSYPLLPRRHIMFEYVMLKGVNDTDADARRLKEIMSTISSKVNLIPFNVFPGASFNAPDDERVLAFQKVLVSAGHYAFIRKSKGQDILAACGQLKAKNC